MQDTSPFSDDRVRRTEAPLTKSDRSLVVTALPHLAILSSQFPADTLPFREALGDPIRIVHFRGQVVFRREGRRNRRLPIQSSATFFILFMLGLHSWLGDRSSSVEHNENKRGVWLRPKIGVVEGPPVSEP